MKNPKRKGITKGDLVRAIKDIGERQETLMKLIRQLNEKITIVDNILGIYVDFNGDTEKLKERIKEVNEDNKTKENTSSNPVSEEEE